MTLGTLDESQAKRLANAGLDYYNHNLDTSPEFYGNIITTRSYRGARTRWIKYARRALKFAPAGLLGWAKR